MKKTLSFIVIYLIIIGLLIGYKVDSYDKLYTYHSTIEYQVQTDDTLWSIANTINIGHKRDTREIIDIIISLSQKKDSTIYDYETLILPVF